MSLAILVGMPREHIKRIRASIERGLAAYRAEWVIRYVPAKRAQAEIVEGDLRSTLQEAACSEDTHIVGVSKQDGKIRQAIAGEVRRYFRFRWLDNKLLGYIGTQVPEFIDALNVILAEEEVWSDRVKPHDTQSPLLLPQPCFETAHPSNVLWQQAEQYGEIGNIVAAAEAIGGFRGRHWLPVEAGGRRWIDSSHRVFDHTGARHGRPPFPRDWKYSYRIPDGFHFDVTTLHGRPFVFRDAPGASHGVDAGGYLNVDPHGYVRSP